VYFLFLLNYVSNKLYVDFFCVFTWKFVFLLGNNKVKRVGEQLTKIINLRFEYYKKFLYEVC